MNAYFMEGLTEFSNYISTFKDETVLNNLKKLYIRILDNKRQQQIELVMIYDLTPNQATLNNVKYGDLCIVELKAKIKLINLQLANISKKTNILNTAKKEISKY